MKILKLLLLLFLIISISSCSNDDQNKSVSIVYPEENPLDAYMSSSGFTESNNTIINNVFTYEMGFSFKPTVKGKINAFIVKIPDVNSAFRITLWDAGAKTVIRSETVNVTAANTTIEKVIIPIALIKDKEYFFTVNSNDWTTRMRTNHSETAYPIKAGNITITGYAYVQTTAAETIFPQIFNNTFYSGDVTFKFQQTE